VISPLLAEASKDRKLRGAPIHVLCYLHATIEIGEYRTVKHLAVAEAVGLTRQRVSQALHLLVELGYIRARSEGGRRVESYMLLNSRAPADVRVEAA
jgi:DNA-binding MarR family transcriptional regulator